MKFAVSVIAKGFIYAACFLIIAALALALVLADALSPFMKSWLYQVLPQKR